MVKLLHRGNDPASPTGFSGEPIDIFIIGVHAGCLLHIVELRLYGNEGINGMESLKR